MTREKILLWEKDVPYAELSPEQAAPTLTCYEVKGSRGAVIVLAGGGYSHKSEHEAYPVAEMINEAGVSAFVLDYRIRPCHKLAPLSDANRAVRLLHYKGYEKVAVLGFSAGGNLCVNAATHYDSGNPDSADPVERCSSRPEGFVPCYAVVSFIDHTHHWTVKNLLGEEYCDVKQQRYFSGEENVTNDTPPAFIWHTASDDCVPVENSLNLAKALSAHSVPYEMHIFPFGPHGSGLAESIEGAREWPELFKRWLIRNEYA